MLVQFNILGNLAPDHLYTILNENLKFQSNPALPDFQAGRAAGAEFQIGQTGGCGFDYIQFRNFILYGIEIIWSNREQNRW